MIHLFADASVMNGSGGIGFVIVTPTQYITGREPVACRNIAWLEILAVCKGFDQLKDASTVTVYSDSESVIDGFPKKQHRNTNGIHRFYNLLHKHCYWHDVTFVKVGKGNFQPLHHRAHHLAREAAANNINLVEVQDGEVRNEVERLLCG